MSDLLKEKFLATIDEVLKNPLMPPQRELIEGMRNTFIALAEEEEKLKPIKHRLDCSLVLNYITERRRMCRHYKNCSLCPINDVCETIEERDPDLLVATVQKFSDENPPVPVKTILDDFKEKYPEYLGYPGGLPAISPCILGYKVPIEFKWEWRGDSIECSQGFDCSNCWNAFLKERE